MIVLISPQAERDVNSGCRANLEVVPPVAGRYLAGQDFATSHFVQSGVHTLLPFRQPLCAARPSVRQGCPDCLPAILRTIGTPVRNSGRTTISSYPIGKPRFDPPLMEALGQAAECNSCPPARDKAE